MKVQYSLSNINYVVSQPKAFHYPNTPPSMAAMPTNDLNAEKNLEPATRKRKIQHLNLSTPAALSG